MMSSIIDEVIGSGSEYAQTVSAAVLIILSITAVWLIIKLFRLGR